MQPKSVLYINEFTSNSSMYLPYIPTGLLAVTLHSLALNQPLTSPSLGCAEKANLSLIPL